MAAMIAHIDEALPVSGMALSLLEGLSCFTLNTVSI